MRKTLSREEQRGEARCALFWVVVAFCLDVWNGIDLDVRRKRRHTHSVLDNRPSLDLQGHPVSHEIGVSVGFPKRELALVDIIPWYITALLTGLENCLSTSTPWIQDSLLVTRLPRQHFCLLAAKELITTCSPNRRALFINNRTELFATRSPVRLLRDTIITLSVSRPSLPP
ncbi:hypothetical protein M011DRAFT_256625 [Sporormia fimetaria CBS 119925]|uniref:Uncharacterized protein n=1 Tax=Sporormia fimetaria CBS 119925 TaxID=1340428 RepID=A0A6A6UZ26_9PLEO|nr:hypothetical protein M011DRAFT_256625 [Sporormia fimetaria CBS 119925]